MKKDVARILLITGVGLFMAVIGYPFLHELGHIIASVLVGAEVLELTILPVPSVLCDITGVGNSGLVMIGFAGTLFPLLISFLIPRRWLVSWCLRTLIQGISVLALIISCVSILFSVNPQDDMIQIMRFWDFGKITLLLILCGITVATSTAIALDKPGRRICKFFCA